MDGTTPIRNSEDIIDSREVIARIAWLERWEVEDDPDLLDDAEREELSALRALAEEASDYAPDWYHGEALIRDSYFEDFAQEMAEDIGAIDREAGWPLYCIDWERAARDLQMDYTAVDFDGVTYWIR